MGRSIEPPAEVRRLEALYRRYHRRVRWVLRGRGIGDHELDDAVHDVFLAIHRRHAERDARVPEELWVTGVARNVAFSYRRGNARRLRILDDAPAPSPARSLDDELARREAWSALRSFLDTLHEDQREAFVLMDLLGMATAEIAEVTGAPANTVSSRVRLARRRFDQRFAELRGREAAFLRAAGRAERPTPQQQQRTWAAIAAAVPLPAAPWVAAPVLGASITKWALGGAVVATLVVGAVVQVGARDPADPVSARASARTSARADTRADTRADARADARASAKAPASRVGRADRPAPTPEATDAEGEGVAGAPGVPPPSPTEIPGAAHVPRTEQARPSTVRDTTSRSSSGQSPTKRASEGLSGGSSTQPAASPEAAHALTEAVELLRRAEAHLTAGDPAAALAAIDRYQERFGRGPLYRDRLRIERRAACAGARADRAHEAHAALVRLGHASAEEVDCP